MDSNGKGTSEVLVSQYEMAVGLYRHEDEMNWNKIKNLFYVSAGLLAVLGVVFTDGAPRNGVDEVSKLIVYAVSLFGLCVSIGFELAMWFGIEYLSERKRAVVRIEERLIAAFDGLPVVSIDEREPSAGHHMAVSPTTLVLKGLPLVIALMWLAIGILAYCA